MKSIAIIGAGPSGLVTAKKCLLMYPNTFKVSLFEKHNRVGGLWAVDPSDTNKSMNPFMPTNLSKYVVSFSDLSWESLKISKDATSPEEYIPEFPKAWMVGQYLEHYRQRYIPNEVLRLNCKITNLSMIDHSKWKVSWEDLSTPNSGTDEEIFDYVIVTTGFLSEPKPINMTATPRTIHSSKFRNLTDIVPKYWDGNGDLLIYGGSMSGVEVAASLASQISDKKFSSNLMGNPKVYHVTDRPFYVFSPLASTDISAKSPSFLPVDLVFFELSSRPEETALASYGRMSTETAQMFHGLFRLQVGGDQADKKSSVIASISTEEAPYISNATGQSYLEFVRSGYIVPVAGRVNDFLISSDQIEVLVTDRHRNTTTIKNIIGSVYANGYKPTLSFLSEEVKTLLDFDENCQRLPIILTNAQTSNPKVPHLAFVGIHESTYWGTEECQARIIVESWVSDLKSITEDESILKDLRKGIAERSRDIPQYLYGDYVGQMEQCALRGFAKRQDHQWNGRKGPAISARYLDKSDNTKEADLTIEKLQETIEKSKYGLFVARAAFLGFQGLWIIHREITSSMSTSPSGLFTGTAEFHPRKPNDQNFDSEYLYIENGNFKTDQGFEMKASRRYAYRYSLKTDKLSTWFIKLDGKTVDYLFLDLSIRRRSENDFWIATGHHPCKPDIYDAEYTFEFLGMALHKFSIKYKVFGPQKDYTSISTYTRPL